MTREELAEYVEMTMEELREKSNEELVAFIDEMGYCQIIKDGKPVFYLIHPELFDEVNATLDIYESLLDQVNGMDEEAEEKDRNKFRS